VRGDRPLPSHQRVLVFSPHPDDDVISMGGILRKLWENENAIVVAYMTSGNIAVFDPTCAAISISWSAPRSRSGSTGPPCAACGRR
jgi:LmbE family N-acetylglucosaminyl deacetylase